MTRLNKPGWAGWEIRTHTHQESKFCLRLVVGHFPELKQKIDTAPQELAEKSVWPHERELCKALPSLTVSVIWHGLPLLADWTILHFHFSPQFSSLIKIMQTALWTVYSAYLCPRRTPGIQVYGLLSKMEEALFVPELTHLRMTGERRGRRALQAFRSPWLPWLSAQSAVCCQGGNGCG